MYRFQKYLAITSFPFVSAKYHLIYKSIWQCVWSKNSLIIIFFIIQNSKNIQNKSQLKKLFITFFLRRKKFYFLTITNSIHKIYTWFAFCILHLLSSTSCRVSADVWTFEFWFSFFCVCLQSSKQVWIEKNEAFMWHCFSEYQNLTKSLSTYTI